MIILNHLASFYYIHSTCWLCFWCNPAATTTVINADAPASSTSTTSPLTSTVEPIKPIYREIKTADFKAGDTPVKYYLTIPEEDGFIGQTIQVELGGAVYLVRIPDYVHKGEKLIVVAPAAATLAKK